MAIGPLLAALGVAAIKNEAKASARRAARRMAFAAATGLLVVLAFGFALAAFTVWLAGAVGAIAALSIVAAGALVLALIVHVAGKAGEPARSRSYGAAAGPLGAAAAAGAEAGAEAGEEGPPAGSTVGSMAVIALVGFILAQQLSRR
jgi:uncharacterized YccA/Bax inhibitor family protein